MKKLIIVLFLLIIPFILFGGSFQARSNLLYGNELGESGILATSKTGWKVGDSITNLTSKGNTPAWNTVRQRFWKNEAFYNAKNYSPENLARLQKGLAPQRFNELLGKWESMELHHIPPMRDGGLFEFIKVWPEEHALIDPYRHY